MKRILVACAAVAFGASVVPAASPPVDAAIKKIQAVVADAGKMKLFCELNGALDAGEDKEDPAVEKKIEGLVTQLGPDFAAAWKVGDDLDETSPDATEFAAAIEAIADKCP